MFFPKYLPLGKESRPRAELASLRHGLDTVSPLVVHALRVGAFTEAHGRYFFCLQRDITGLLREIIKNEESSRWQMKHSKRVKSAITHGFADLDAIYHALSLVSGTQTILKPRTYIRVTHVDRKDIQTAMTPSSIVRINNRSSTESRTASSFDD